MSGRKYFCFCEANCKWETMTKEQILAAIAQAAESGLVFDADAAFISKVKEINAGNTMTFWMGTQAQFNALDNVDHASCFYIITDSMPFAVVAPTLAAHLANKQNPHGVTAEQVGARPNNWIPTATEVGAVEIKEVWENASASSAFAAQTISLDLAAFEFVLIEFRTTPSSGSRAVKIVRNGTQGLISELVNVSSNGSYMTAILRLATVSDTGVKFGTGYSKGMSDADTEENTSRVIPTKIYGIKGVK